MASTPKIRIAHLAGPTATIQNTPPLVTSNKARAKYGLPPRMNADGSLPAFDPLRTQRLALPAKVYVEQFSAHPLEADKAELYGPPDGYVDADGALHAAPSSPSDKPVYEIELRPEDGVYPLPYMARQADGSAWEEECAKPGRTERQGAARFLSRRIAQFRRDRSPRNRRRGHGEPHFLGRDDRLFPRRTARRLHQGPAR